MQHVNFAARVNGIFNIRAILRISVLAGYLAGIVGKLIRTWRQQERLLCQAKLSLAFTTHDACITRTRVSAREMK